MSKFAFKFNLMYRYTGALLNDGAKLIKDSAEDCCRDCADLPGCNVWVLCVLCEGDCVQYAFHSCWLKRARPGLNMEALAARDSSPDVPWTSGWFHPSTLHPHADLDRSILLEWRATSPKLQRLWRDANAPLSAWKGVTVGGAKGRVVKLSLSQRKLTSVPASIGNLAALTRLSFRWNKLASVPAELGRLKRLERLKLEFNELTSVPGKLGNLAALKVLDLFSNKLTSVPLQFGVGLYGLNSVDP
jgi:hypothetical protein